MVKYLPHTKMEIRIGVRARRPNQELSAIKNEKGAKRERRDGGGRRVGSKWTYCRWSDWEPG